MFAMKGHDSTVDSPGKRRDRRDGVALAPPSYGVDVIDGGAVVMGRMSAPASTDTSTHVRGSRSVGARSGEGERAMPARVSGLSARVASSKAGPAKCACGGTCATCSDEASKVAGPGKAVGVRDPDDREKPDPSAGSATIRCDGKGGWRILLNDYATAKCGTKNCVIAHESSHIKDWKAKWPDGCKGQPDTYLPKGDPPDDPVLTVSEYNAFLKKSECDAHTIDLECAKKLPQEGACKQTVKDYIKLTEQQKAGYC